MVRTEQGPSKATALHVSAGGPTDAAFTLLLIHPMGADLTFWSRCREFFEEHHCCIAVDLRGAGASPASSRPVSIEAHADDLAEFVDRAGLRNVVPVGCAVGAMVAAALAGRHPASIRALVLCNPGFKTQPAARDMLAMRAATARKGGMPAVLPGAVDSAFVDCPRDVAYEAYFRRFANQDPVAYALQIEAMLDADTEPFLGKITCPTLIVAGGKDPLLPVEHARAIKERLAEARLVEIPDGAHFIPYQRPEEFSALVGDFLQKARHARSSSAPGTDSRIR
ncbi:3-oxoadipate enol-lactonase/3-oxoadipate enol-lactonase/4-carboxymuconolactone decarboxylase [Mesorhizobium sp. J18]|nr:3-oxoadipate enol-lactonase/3-oxoadipate enol-lactonase/4-carboxymuconolactone decarboxylase [Mesorhizobium sp. J18]